MKRVKNYVEVNEFTAVHSIEMRHIMSVNKTREVRSCIAVLVIILACIFLIGMKSSPVKAAFSDDTSENGYLQPGTDDTAFALPEESDQHDLLREAALPVKYDGRENGTVSSVKDQSPWGTCWAFSGISSLESNANVNGSAIADLSEKAPSWFAYQLTNNEGRKVVSTAFTNGLYNFGGNRYTFTGLMAAWDGAQTEAQVPYTNAAGTLATNGDWSVQANLRSENSIRLTDADFLPTTVSWSNSSFVLRTQAVNIIKQKILDTGAVEIGFNSNKSLPGASGVSANWNEATDAQFTNVYKSANHSVSIIGWDDDFAASNFKNTPEGNGAWIVKNSWGSTFGENGYFYLSYYDRTITSPTAYSTDSADDSNGLDYDNNYQYDYLGLGSNSFLSSYEQETAAANIFTAKGHETLSAVSAVTGSTDSTVQTDIYLLDSNTSSPTAGTLAASFRTNVTYAGYHTLKLDQALELAPGQRFSVVQRIKSSQGWFLPVEFGYSKSHVVTGVGSYESVAVRNGESYVLENGSWVDSDKSSLTADDSNYVPGDAMIKAFTKNIIDENVLNKITVTNEPASMVVGEEASLEVAFTPENFTGLRDVTVSSDNEKVVGAAGSRLTAVAPGTAVIRVSPAADDTKAVSFTVTVTANPVQTLPVEATDALGGYFTVNVSDIPEGSSVLYAVWSKENAQDDLVWSEGTRDSAGKNSFIIDTATHKGDTGDYYIHVYLRDVAGGTQFYGAVTVNVPTGSVQYDTHIQNIAWQGLRQNGVIGGTSGQSLRMEALKISLAGDLPTGSISYQSHIQDDGWESSWHENGDQSGTTGSAKRLEAIKIKLSGKLAEQYSVYYRVHAQNLGWLNWACDGEPAGSAGFSYRLEAIQIRLVPKGAAPPAGNGTAFVSK